MKNISIKYSSILVLSDFNAKSKKWYSILKAAQKERKLKIYPKVGLFQTIHEPTDILDTSRSCVSFLQLKLPFARKIFLTCKSQGEAPVLTAILEMTENANYISKQLQTLCSYCSTFFVSPGCKFIHGIITF